MASQVDLLKEAMRATGVSQSALARISGVRQPSISQFLSGAIRMSDDQVDRLLACLGLRLEVERRAVPVSLTRSERRSWALHRAIAASLDSQALEAWRPKLRVNVDRLRSNVHGQPHARNIERWADLVESGDLGELHRSLTGLDRKLIEMREVTPFSGLLPDTIRRSVLAGGVR